MITERLWVGEKYIFTLSETNNYYLFNRRGKFLRQISSQGRGPGQYTSRASSVMINEKDSLIFLSYASQTKKDCFHLNGDYLYSMNYTSALEKYGKDEPGHSCVLNDTIWVEHITNGRGNCPVRLLLISGSGDLIKEIPNFSFWEGLSRQTIKKGAGMEYETDFYYNDGKQLFFREERGDTVFEITPSMELKPHLIFSFHDGVSYAQRRLSITKNHMDRLIKETEDVILFGYRYLNFNNIGLYIKDENKGFRLVEGGPEPRRGSSRTTGLIDDLTGGISLSGYKHIYPNTSPHDCLIDYVTVVKLQSLLTPQYLSETIYRDTLAHERLKQMMDTLDEYANPVVVITHLKKQVRLND